MKKWTDKQIEILKKAIELIPEKGLPSVTFKNIAKEFKLTEPAIFRHFKSKKFFIEALYNFSKEEFHKTLEKIVSEDLPANEKLYLLLQKNLYFLETKKGVNFYLLTYSIFYNDKNLMSVMKKIIDDYKSFIKRILEEGINKKVFRKINTEIHSDIFLGMTQSLVIQYILSGKKRKFVHKTKEMFEGYMKGINY